MSVGGGVMAGMETFTLVPRGPFSLAASIKFLEGFTPAAYRGSDPGADGVLELAFPVEGSWETVGIRVRQDSAGVTAEHRQSGGAVARPGSGGAPSGRANPLARRGRIGVPRGRRARPGGRRGPTAVSGPAPGGVLVPLRGRGLDCHRAPHPHHAGRGGQGPDGERARRTGQLRRPGGVRLPVPGAAGQARHVPRAGRAQAGMAPVGWRRPPWTASSTPPGCGPCRTRRRWPT